MKSVLLNLIFPLKPKLYRSVIEDVINDVRDIFLDDGVDEQVLMELKTVSLFLCKEYHPQGKPISLVTSK